MQQKEFPAHIRVEEGERIVQSVEEHCRKTAAYSSAALQPVGLEKTGYLLGLTHDCGKMTGLFSDYIQRAADGEAVRRGSVNHTFSAVKLLLRRFHNGSGDPFRRLPAELLAFAVGAHHGLFDCTGPDRKNGFTHRLDSENELFEEASANFLDRCRPQELDQRFSEACGELRPIIEHLVEMARRDPGGAELSYYFGCLARLLLSALIDGDRKDTAEFMSGSKPPAKPSMSSDRWRQLLDRMENRLNTLDGEGDIQRARAALSQVCRDRAALPAGIYRLNLPTGAGKTLSSLRFALAHASEQNKTRIIFTSPLLSILEQNAAVIRAFLQDDSIILEHHSNVVRTEAEGDALSPTELFTESWDAPVIITTLVQLLNTLFSGETTAIRRFHSLCSSVIVIDEIQTLPTKLLSMFQLAVSFLTEVCGATVVLCSATQPAQEFTPHPFLAEPADLVPYNKAIWDVFQRTELREADRCTLEEMPGAVMDKLENSKSLLIICNKKDEAAFLFRALQDEAIDCFHLSASMCAAHRRKTLEALYASLADHSRKTICVSTQVIEAGVDISFDCVIRLTAGMDSVVQAAGRCNRNGESKSRLPVYIMNCWDEDLSRLCEIRRAKDATTALLAEYRRAPEIFAADLASDRAIRTYYKFLYQHMNEGAMDYPAGEYGNLFDLLASNKKYATEYADGYGQYFLCQAFKTAGQQFCVFDAQTQTVLVPYGEGADIIRRVQEIGDRVDPEALRELRTLLQRAKSYAVSVFSYQVKQLEKQGAVDRICHDSVLILQPDCFGDVPYSNEIGLITEKG